MKSFLQNTSALVAASEKYEYTYAALLHFRTPLLLLMTHHEKMWPKAVP